MDFWNYLHETAARCMIYQNYNLRIFLQLTKICYILMNEFIVWTALQSFNKFMFAAWVRASRFTICVSG